MEKENKIVLALVAHDNKKEDIVNWCKENVTKLKEFSLILYIFYNFQMTFQSDIFVCFSQFY